jgi:nucleotide-binding universal stress UspA family protein
MPPIDVYVTSEIGMPAALIQHYMDLQHQVAERVKHLFEVQTAQQDFVAEWRQVDNGITSAVNAITEQGNTSDLLIMSQFDGGRAGSGRNALPAQVLSRCGRPVLVVPRAYEPSVIGERVFAAWDGGRESTRALFSALPMLRRASQVRVQRINSPHADRHHVVGLTEELANTLSRHGVSVEVFQSDASKSEVGEELLHYAADTDSDVIVMGCYGHGALRDLLLGSTTRHVLEHMKVPVLMST